MQLCHGIKINFHTIRCGLFYRKHIETCHVFPIQMLVQSVSCDKTANEIGIRWKQTYEAIVFFFKFVRLFLEVTRISLFLIGIPA